MVTYFHCCIHFAFLLQTFFQPEYLGTIQTGELKFVVKDGEANDLKNIFQKMQKFWICVLATQDRITPELSVFKLP